MREYRLAARTGRMSSRHIQAAGCPAAKDRPRHARDVEELRRVSYPSGARRHDRPADCPVQAVANFGGISCSPAGCSG
ncbi:MAG: hypothetical protein ABSC73_08875, partial [Acidimicrobiales bacterium]